MTITRQELTAILSRETNFSIKQSAEFIDQVFEIMMETLAIGEKVKISGFGNFTVRQKQGRIGRNPKTGEKMRIAGRRVVTFKSSPRLRKALSKGDQ